ETPGVLIDLQQYIAPEGKPSDSKLGDVANAHFCFGVKGLPEAYKALSARGVQFVSEPVTFELEGGTVHVVFLKDPDGFVLELMVNATVERFGRVDVLVNNAGVGAVAPLLDTDEATWDRLMAVNAKSVLLCSQAAARRMIAQGGGGRIINNASGAGKTAPGKD